MPVQHSSENQRDNFERLIQKSVFETSRSSIFELLEIPLHRVTLNSSECTGVIPCYTLFHLGYNRGIIGYKDLLSG